MRQLCSDRNLGGRDTYPRSQYKETAVKKFSEMTDIGFKRTLTKMRKTDDLVKETAKVLRCAPEDILERIQAVNSDIEKLKEEIQKLKNKL